MGIDFTNLFIIFFASIITQNMVLSNFLGLCPFVAISKGTRHAFIIDSIMSLVFMGLSEFKL